MTQTEAAKARNAHLKELSDSLISASDYELGAAVLDVSRRVRREIVGHVDGVPNMATPDEICPESTVVWAYMVDIADRLMSPSGVSVMRTADEKSVQYAAKDTALALRDGLAAFYRPSDFNVIAIKMRHAKEASDDGKVTMADILGRSFSLGNILEIATARVVEIEAGAEARAQSPDTFSKRINFMRIEHGLAPIDGGLATFTPDLGDAVSASLADAQAMLEKLGPIGRMADRLGDRDNRHMQRSSAPVQAPPPEASPSF